MRSCEVRGCTNPNSSSPIEMHYGEHAICNDCLKKAIAAYIQLKKDLSYIL